MKNEKGLRVQYIETDLGEVIPFRYHDGCPPMRLAISMGWITLDPRTKMMALGQRENTVTMNDDGVPTMVETSIPMDPITHCPYCGNEIEMLKWNED